MKHYKEKQIAENTFVREFESGIDYPWHRDPEDRVVEVMSVQLGWKFQKDNELPIALYNGLCIDIKKNVFHRIIPGNSRLILKVTKLI